MTEDPHYYTPTVTSFWGWTRALETPTSPFGFSPTGSGDRVIVLFAHYQERRTPDENAKICLAIHQARGYGQLTGGWGDPSAPDMLRAYSQVFGVEIAGPRRPVDWGHEAGQAMAQDGACDQGIAGLVFSRAMPTAFSGDAWLQRT